jgi:cell shape-determining protein MreD
MIPLLITLLKIAVISIYVAGAYKFWTGFRQTNFTSGRILLTLLWPACWAINPRYRQNFSRALRGR